MNIRRQSDPDHFKSLQILDELSANHSVTQRDLSKRLGIALGLVNSYVRNLVKKGYVTVRAIPPKRYAYYLTPKGFVEKSRLTYDLLSDYTRIYREARATFLKAFLEMKSRGISRVVFAGADEVAEIAYITLRETDMELAGIADSADEGRKFFDHRVVSLEALAAGEDHIVVTSYVKRRKIYGQLLEAGVPPERISMLWDIPGAYEIDGRELAKHTHVIWHEGEITRSDWNRLNNHKSGLVWFTGLSASGKSTIAHGVQEELFTRGIRSYVLDGDNIRHGLNCNLSFNPNDRKENIRRVVEVARLFADAGILVLAAFISPYREDRNYIRKRFEGDNFLEIYVKCPIGVCEDRDPKGQYKKARAGAIKNYTGISSPYEEPESPDLVLETDRFDVGTAVGKVVDILEARNILTD